MPNRKPGTVRKWLSYLSEIPVESVPGEFTETLEVVYHNGRYMLNAPSATYSYEDLYSSFSKAFQHIDIGSKKIDSVLVLGLGLGSIPWILQKRYQVKVQIDCVEIDPVVIALAEKYYPSPVSFRKLKIHQADAYEWMMENNKSFDLIAVDLFIDRFIPEDFHSREFLEKLKRSVNKNGILLFSRLTENRGHEKELWENIRKIFPDGFEIDTRGNTILSWMNKNESKSHLKNKF